MTDVLQKFPCQPNKEVMEEFASKLFSSLGMRGLVELSWTSVRSPHRLEFARHYDIGDLDRLIDDAARLNANPNCNVYISAGLRKVGTVTHKRARDEDVQSVTALWADFDTPGSLDAAIAKVDKLGIVPNIVTYTGQHPHLRGQMWWLLDEPCDDFALHELLERKLAIELGADKSVINRSRVMRFIGSVAWPLKAERTLEMTGLVEADVRAAPFVIDELRRKLGGINANAGTTTSASSLLDFSTAEPTIETQDLIAFSVEPHQFHANALKVTGRLIAQGMKPEDVYGVLSGAVRAAGVNVPERLSDLKKMVTSAAAKFTPTAHKSEPATAPDQPLGGADRPNPFLTIKQLIALPPPVYLIDKFLIERGMSVLHGAPGTFKSFIALDLALSVAHGIPWHGFETKQRRVLYICGEGQAGLGTRALLWQQERVNNADTEDFMLLPLPVNFLEPQSVGKLLEDIQHFIGDVGFVVIDTLARSFGTGDENKTQDMNAFVRGVGRLASKAMVLVVHHTGKDESKDERGSSALRGALDATFKLRREPGSDTVTFVTKKQKEGEEHAPINFVMGKAEAPHPLTGELLSSLIPTLGKSSQPTSMKDPTLTRNHLALLASLRALGPSTQAAIAIAVSKDKSNVGRWLRLLSDRGLVAQDNATRWFVVGADDDD